MPRGFVAVFTALVLCSSAPALAQRGGDSERDRGDRGSERGDRGSDRGGEDGSRSSRFGGGPPGGFGGGPPGGFGGGPPGGFGGGPPGGFGGGPPGGFGGGSPGGFSRGGFDPSSFIDRLDRNGNGMLDPDEMEGPAGFMIQRLQRDDSSIRTDRPIPMSKLREAFDRMRGGSGVGGDSGGPGGNSPSEDDGLAVTELVPGFGGIEMPPPIPGFGATADLLAVRITEEDKRQAEETLQRYDRNKNNFIDADETSSRWSGNPMDFDQNHDNKLSVNELAVRYARRRMNDEDKKTSQRSDRRNRREEPAGTIEVADHYEGRVSYRRQSRTSVEGVPGWFTDKDTDKDGQIRMSEYTSDWNEEVIKEFYGYDRNFDGIVTAEEAVYAVENGPSTRTTDSAAPSRSAAVAPVSADKIDPKYISYAERILSRSDKNGDKELTASEWKGMIMDISPADGDRNGRITIQEYAGWLQARANNGGK